MKLSVTKSSIEHLVAMGCTDLIVEGIKELEAENAALKAEVDKPTHKKPAFFIWTDKTFIDKVEFDKLQAENERLKEIIRREVDGGVDLREEAQRTVEENHKLRAEIEQLKAQIEDQAQRCADYEDLVKHYKQQRDEAYNDLPDWQAIETAPKDGTWVLLATNIPERISGIPELDCWFSGVAMGRYVKEEEYDYDEGWMQCSEYSVSIEPTHWMRLPERPAAKGVQS